VPAAVVHRPGEDPGAILDAALEAGGFWDLLRRRRASSRVRKALLAIAIKPDLDIFHGAPHPGTDPALVERLVARLRGEGYRNVVVCDGRNRPDGWLLNRDALCVPDLAGYRFEAPEGDPYDMAWVEDDPVPIPLASSDASGELEVAGGWARAHFRISFARARTDEEWGYALSLANLLGLIPPGAVAASWPPRDQALHLLRRTPPHFALIDAVVGSHGPSGSREPRSLRLDTLVASPDPLAADWVAALKMGADPHVSPLNALALQEVGLPPEWSLLGDTSPWSGWVNPAPLRVEAVQGRARWPELDSLARAVLQPVDRELFPFREILVDQLSATVLRQLDRITEPTVREGVELLLARALHWAAGARSTFAANVTKGEVLRVKAPLTLEVDALPLREFQETWSAVEAQARTLDGTPPDPRGFRFRTVGGHIHFAASRVLSVPFLEFVERVEISAAIRYMNDYLGGGWLVVEEDDRGRPIRQVERNFYLPQPNWIGVFGGEYIDVEKVETIRRTPEREEIRWRTLRSPNNSAESDDGSVVFLRTPGDEVEVRIFARQRFRLPPAVAAVGVERWPDLHRELVADAYARFFHGTIANLRAAHQGRPWRIGREPAGKEALEDGSELREVLTGAVALLSRVLGWVPGGLGGSPVPGGKAGVGVGGAPLPFREDDAGFRHFPGVAVPAVVDAAGSRFTGEDGLTPMTFLVELGRAVGRDLAASGVPQLAGLVAGIQGGPGGHGGGGDPAGGGPAA